LAAVLAEPNLPDLIVAYWEELSPHKGKIPLEPDWPLMGEMEAAGHFKIWVCRVDQTVAGFLAFHFITHIAYRGTVLALDAGHYLASQWRDTGRIGYRMWRSVKPALKAEGAIFAMLHDNASRPLMPFFLALGAEPRSTIFWWDLTDA
jgi:hypothetical protein